jgi:hypothetical protein
MSPLLYIYNLEFLKPDKWRGKNNFTLLFTFFDQVSQPSKAYFLKETAA